MPKRPDDSTADTVALAIEGLRPCEIAEMTGLTPNQVSCRLRYWRARGEDIPCSKGGPWRPRRRICAMGVADDLRGLLIPHAERRGLSIGELCRNILDIAAREGLIDSILDDGYGHD